MRDVFIFDHVRTPRGRGKPDGGLHAATPVELARQLLVAVKARGNLPDDCLDEVVLGTVTTAGEQGATLPRIAPILAGFSDRAPGLQINRACASARCSALAPAAGAKTFSARQAWAVGSNTA